LSLVNGINVALSKGANQVRGPKNLLFVDDEASIRLTLPPILEQHGFGVRSASNVAEALEMLAAHQFDVLLTDLNIGEPGDGFVVVRAMRKAQPLCVTILLTGYPGFETALEAIHHEVDVYLAPRISITWLAL
jgi:DNA-binding NtrC family response regulator